MSSSSRTEVVVEKASAKINLALDVLGKRADGYHEVCMVMQSAELSDLVRINLADRLCVQTDRTDLPNGPDNLAWRAALAFERATGKKAAVAIQIEKRIPLGAGLAGGSTDAAAVLRGLNRLLNANLSVAELQQIGAAVGSDVPFCIAGGTALAEGRGELITPLADLPPCPVVLANPGFEVSTASVYGGYRAELVRQRPDIKGMLAAIAAGDWSAVMAAMGNVLESVTLPAYPVVAQIKQTMLAQGACAALMSGSGPTVFALAQGAAQADALAQAVRKETGAAIYITETKRWNER